MFSLLLIFLSCIQVNPLRVMLKLMHDFCMLYELISHPGLQVHPQLHGALALLFASEDGHDDPAQC